MKQFWKEFKEFALKGNVMNLAVGVMIGAAFQGVVTSLTDNILSPVIGLLTGKNFDALSFDIFGVIIGYGAFITSILNFFILAFVVFLLVRIMNRIMAARPKNDAEPATEPATKECPHCYSTIDARARRCSSCTSHLD